MTRRLAVLALLVAASAQAAEDRDTLYQVSTIDALLAGVYEPAARVGDVLSHGDFGLGTFEALDGELILLDGQVYRASADGTVSRVPPTVGTPFMAVTRFDTDRTFDAPPGLDFPAFKAWMEGELPSRNIPYALRVKGRFARIGFRSVPKQTQPYPPLTEVSKQQKLFELKDVSGAP